MPRGGLRRLRRLRRLVELGGSSDGGEGGKAHAKFKLPFHRREGAGGFGRCSFGSL